MSTSMQGPVDLYRSSMEVEVNSAARTGVALAANWEGATFDSVKLLWTDTQVNDFILVQSAGVKRREVRDINGD